MIFGWIKICLIENITPTSPAETIEIKWDNLMIWLKGNNEKIMNNIPHFNINVHRGTSKTKSCLSKIALETFYQTSQIPKKSFFNC